MVAAARLARGLALVVLLDVLGWWCCLPPAAAAIAAVRTDRSDLGAWPLDRLASAAAATGCLAVLATGTLVVLLTVADALVGSRSRLLHEVAGRLTPGAARRAVLSLCGLGIAGAALTAPAAVADEWTAAGRCPPACGIRVNGLPLPELPTTRESASTVPLLVTVRPGDSLWRISERLLPADASPSRIAAVVDRLYAVNREVVGPDPDLIFPGMHLVAPEGPS